MPSSGFARCGRFSDTSHFIRKIVLHSRLLRIFSLVSCRLSSFHYFSCCVRHFLRFPFQRSQFFILFVFHFTHFSFYSFFILFIFQFIHFPFYSFSILFIFHFIHFSFHSFSILFISHFIHFPFSFLISHSPFHRYPHRISRFHLSFVISHIPFCRYFYSLLSFSLFTLHSVFPVFDFPSRLVYFFPVSRSGLERPLN